MVHVTGLHYLHQNVFNFHCVIVVINLSFHCVKSINQWCPKCFFFFFKYIVTRHHEMVTLSKGHVQIMDNKQRGLAESRFQNHYIQLSKCKLEYSYCELMICGTWKKLASWFFYYNFLQKNVCFISGFSHPIFFLVIVYICHFQTINEIIAECWQ